MLRRGKQHRRVPVVAAGVHLAVVLARMREGVELGDRQRIHVGTQADRAVAGAVLDDAHHAGRAEAAVDRDAPFGELARDHVGGADFFEAEFGVGVEVTSDGGDAGRLRDERIDEFHGLLSKRQSIH